MQTLKKVNKIIPIWQPPGHSTHILSKKVAESLGVKTSHTGTLDPMAEGVVIILSDEERLKKYEYAKWLKTYEFEIVLGIKTDSGDGLGMIESISMPTRQMSEAFLGATLASFLGEYTQKVPSYSAIKVKGKPMHWWARNNRLNEVGVPVRHGKIHNIELIGITEISATDFIPELCDRIKLIEGDLRQDVVLAQWKEFSRTHDSQCFQKICVRVEMTKGLYVRTLASDICEKLGTCGFVYRLVRTQNGEYTKDKCSFPNEFLASL